MKQYTIDSELTADEMSRFRKVIVDHFQIPEKCVRLFKSGKLIIKHYPHVKLAWLPGGCNCEDAVDLIQLLRSIPSFTD